MPSDNNPTRRLAAILFADIVGYTAMMQSDEGNAMNRLQRYQNVLNTTVTTHQGEVIKNYGDGSLCVFSSVLDAVQCAHTIQKELQKEPTVPLRIGLHLGDVMYSANDIYGNDINIASRIESMGIGGAVLMSKNIYQKVSNQADLEFQSLGIFEFKNVDEPMEIFALANDGLSVPEADEMKGKIKISKSDTGDSFFQRIWNKKIPQILGIYILAAWLGLQVFDWALGQFGISPHWGQIFFITVIGLIPSLLVYINNRERIHQSKFEWLEKILFPSNVVILGAVLFFMFRTADLGATDKNVTFINALGEEETHNIVKSEFRKQFVIFPFDEIEPDSANQWIGLGMSSYLDGKLSQNKYLSPMRSSFPQNRKGTTSEKIEDSNFTKEDYYIDGQYEVNGDNYEFTPAIRNSTSGRLIKEEKFSGTDIFSLVDSMTIFINKAVGLSQSQIDESTNLPFREIYTDNFEALKAYTIGSTRLGNYDINIERALALDSTFAYAFLQKAANANDYERGKLESEYLITRAMKYRRRLPHEAQISVMITNHIIHQEWDKAEKLLKFQLEIDPNSDAYNDYLINLYYKTGQIKKIVKHAEARFSKDPTNLGRHSAFTVALLLDGRCEKAIEMVEDILWKIPHNPGVLSWLGQANILCKNYDKAREYFEKVSLINPEFEKFMDTSISTIEYIEKNGMPKDLVEHVGDFRDEAIEMIISYRIIADNIYDKASNQGGMFTFPSGDNELSRGIPGQGYSSKLEFDSKGKVYGVLYKQWGADRDSEHFLWKQDSTIWNAESELRKGNYENALPAYETVYKDNPKHYYLEQGGQHAHYILNNTKEDVQKNYDRLVGDYGEVKIWEEDGLLYYKRPGVLRRVFRPISNNLFTSLSRYKTNYEFVEENGKIVAIRSYDYDRETEEWTLDPDWYYERTELLN